ncbi:hypothetical protein KM043_016329 [Ampulex compressa]|nr:hypothetical protein KM043_016329 [Ampulex compressa]
MELTILHLSSRKSRYLDRRKMRLHILDRLPFFSVVITGLSDFTAISSILVRPRIQEKEYERARKSTHVSWRGKGRRWRGEGTAFASAETEKEELDETKGGGEKGRKRGPSVSMAISRIADLRNNNDPALSVVAEAVGPGDDRRREIEIVHARGARVNESKAGGGRKREGGNGQKSPMEKET